jgi:hypothetical protein
MFIMSPIYDNLYMNIDDKHQMYILQKRRQKLSAVAIVLSSLLVLTGLVFVQPIQKAFAQQQPDCTLSQAQPTDPVDMNTVIFKTIAKTVHVEKEIYINCRGIVPTVLDVSTYTELKEDLASFPRVIPKVSFEVIACNKIIPFGSPVGCKQMVPSTTNLLPNASACKQVNIAFPIEMNTITSPNGIVKTVESEKEAFICKVTGNVPPGFGSMAMKEVTIFTEIFEDVGQGKIVKMSEFTTCMKPVGPAPITSKTIICQASKPSVIPF